MFQWGQEEFHVEEAEEEVVDVLGSSDSPDLGFGSAATDDDHSKSPAFQEGASKEEEEARDAIDEAGSAGQQEPRRMECDVGALVEFKDLANEGN
jgi:hypothetical protein